jgi:PIN domain nuclease of toxin-antitoxin system
VNLLLDTHAFLWWQQQPEELSAEAREAIAGPNNLVVVSAVVAWEIAIKRSLGKLVTGDVMEAIEGNNFHTLAVTVEHARAIESLPPLHRDPFDRMLIAQALTEGLTLVTRDEAIRSYSVSLLAA